MKSHQHLTDFLIFHPTIQKNISFRPVTIQNDLHMLHEWMHQSHVVPYWNLAISLEKYKEHLTTFLDDPHQMLHIGLLDNIPMSYWESYWAEDDVVGQTYDVHPEDQGVHLLFGPASFLGKGYSYPLLQTMIYRLFQHKKTEKIIAEPDIRNEKMIHIFQKCGFEKQKTIELPDKQAVLLFCDRETFLRSWKDR